MNKLTAWVCAVFCAAWCLYAQESQEEKPRGECLSDHVAVVQFEGVTHRPCMFRTALCPDRCDHATHVATFKVLKYESYAKHGQYGDEEQTKVFVDMNPAHKPVFQPDSVITQIDALKPGDKVRLHWAHYYMHYKGVSSPERPVLELTILPDKKEEQESPQSK